LYYRTQSPDESLVRVRGESGLEQLIKEQAMSLYCFASEHGTHSVYKRLNGDNFEYQKLTATGDGEKTQFQESQCSKEFTATNGVQLQCPFEVVASNGKDQLRFIYDLTQEHYIGKNHLLKKDQTDKWGIVSREKNR